jgi:hypothetical protein
MDTFVTRLATLSKKPEFGSDEYTKWLEQNDFVQFLQAMPCLDEILLYASAAHSFLYSVLVPTRLVTPPDTDDLDRWSCDPFSCWSITIAGGGRSRVFLSPPLAHTGSTTLDRGEQIVFVRRFDGRQEQQSYIEISPRLTHPFDLHYVPERSAYCRFDNHGDVEDVIRVADVPSGNPDEHDPLQSLKQILRELHEARVLWWKLRDEALTEKVHYPIAKSSDEWAKEIHALDKLLIEGFEKPNLSSRVKLLGRTVDKDWQSLKLLSEVLCGLGRDEAEVQEVVKPLQELHFLRSKVSGHASGTETKKIKAEILKEYKAYSEHFRQLCSRCDTAVRTLRTSLEPKN